MKKLVIGFVLVFFSQAIYCQVDTIKYGIKGKVIRALAKTNTAQPIFYAGLKGNFMGSALVYKSMDAGTTWEACNSGQAIGPYASDIQAIAIATDAEKTIYAGTWKEGLFRSKDDGDSWQRLSSAPSPDIRSLKVGTQNPKLVYAATSSFGVMKSTDGGDTWRRNDPAAIDSTFRFAWSIEIDESNDNILFAQTYRNGVWKSVDQGDSWTKTLDVPDQVCWDMKKYGSSLWVASSKSRDSLSRIHYSANLGESWVELSDVPQIGISQINVIQENGKQILYIGSWSDGVYRKDGDQWEKVTEIDFDTISEILQNGDGLLIGSWGNGIYNIE